MAKRQRRHWVWALCALLALGGMLGHLALSTYCAATQTGDLAAACANNARGNPTPDGHLSACALHASCVLPPITLALASPLALTFALAFLNPHALARFAPPLLPPPVF